jgi:hypothetical protein
MESGKAGRFFATVAVSFGDDSDQSATLSQLHHGIVTVGRSASAGVHLRPGWVSRNLVQLAPCPFGWCAVNGYRAQMRVVVPHGETWVATGGGSVLALGQHVLSWPELPHRLEVTVNVTKQSQIGLPLARDDPARPKPAYTFKPSLIGPANRLSPRRPAIELTPLQRLRMAVLFRHLLKGEPRPQNLTATAAAELGIAHDVMKKTVRDVRRSVRRQRQQVDDFDIDQLGRFLVTYAELITEDHLPLRPGRRAHRRAPPGAR